MSSSVPMEIQERDDGASSSVSPSNAATSNSAINSNSSNTNQTASSLPSSGLISASMGDTGTASLGVLEHSLMKVPYESLNRHFRNSQKVIEKEMASLMSTYNDLQKKSMTPNSNMVVSAPQAIDNVVLRLSKLKRKLEEMLSKEDKCIQRCKARLDHLQQYQTARETSSAEGQFIWHKARLDRILIDYLLREHYFTTAQQLAESSSISELVDIDIVTDMKAVEDSLKNSDCTVALNWCNNNKSKLKKMESTFEFNLRRQEFVELLRVGKRLEAITYAKKNLSLFADTNLKDIQAVMGCLAFSADTKCDQYKFFFEQERWQDLIEQFNIDGYVLHSFNTQSLLSVTLQAGLSSLKTNACFDPEGQNPNCPVCSPLFHELASQLPYSHRTQSSLVCKLTGEVMNEHNLPLALPNGNVYSQKGILEQAKQNNGVFIDPKTSDKFKVDEMKKVFVL